ncbi:MAG: serine hydrolase domain-containing protein [Clostridia bacterium]|nr:serine hydrolase domain-containing protein [Clostridia bacterium]
MNFENFKSFMESLTDWIIPGNSAVVYKDGKKVFEYGSGYSDMENKTPMTADDLIYIYSCSKITTVTAALQLYERGRFLLNDPLYEYIPEFKDMYLAENGEKVKNPITMWNLFTMTAGLTYNKDTPAFDKAKRLTNGKMDTLTVARCIAEDPLLFEPGKGWNYSLCHDVLAAAVEVISGKRFSEYVKENIFDALDMNSSAYHLKGEDKKRMSRLYIYDKEAKNKEIVHDAGCGNSLIFGEEYDSGGAGIISTVNDYAKLAAALANKGMGLNNNKILAPGTVELLKTNQLNAVQMKNFNWAQFAGYGYGLGVRTMIDRVASGSNGSVGEFGWEGAAGADILMDTDLNLAVFYAHHMLNPQIAYFVPRVRNVIYSCL